MICLSYLAWVLWCLGYPDQALQRSQEALSLARDLSHPFSLVMALDFAALFHQLRREARAAREQAEAAIALCSEQAFALAGALGTILQGWALAEQEQGEEVMAQIRQGMATFQAIGANLFQPYLLALLAETSRKAGQLQEGLNILAEAFALVDKTGEQYYAAQLYRFKGELLLACSTEHHEVAETCFHQALAVARRQQAKSWELQAAMSLSHLWQQQGKRQEAHDLLAEVYGWFTEGFDTADLQEAKALLEALA
jgi:predicted ATPase